MESSVHLDDIIERHNGIGIAQVVGVDIEKYSRRRTQAQVAVISAFTDCVRAALEAVSKTHIGYAQKNDVNFATDIIRIPTGDGIFVAFGFDGLPDIHLGFAKALLSAVHDLNQSQSCERFDTDGWCNCHTNHNVRVSLSEGKTIFYRDVNGAYNIAGEPINIAARLDGMLDSNQILFSDQAYTQIVDMVDDPALADNFRRYDNVTIKHGLRISVYQYIEDGLDFLNVAEPEDLRVIRDMHAAAVAAGRPLNELDNVDPKEVSKVLLTVMQNFGGLMGGGGAGPPSKGAGGSVQ